MREVARLKKQHGTDYTAASEDLAGWFRAMKSKPAFANRRFRYLDARGAYKEDDPTAPGGRRFELRDPRNGSVIPLRPNRGWSFDQDEFDRLVAEERISFISDTTIMVRRYLHETDTLTPPSVFYQPARSASERLSKLMGESVFDFPKDETILQKFIQMATSGEAEPIILDFFAGSGTTGHAVIAQNLADGEKRRFILVQLPEVLNFEKVEQAAAARYCENIGRPANIAELTKERLRRVVIAAKNDDPLNAGDLGFRVFKLASSNIRAWEPELADLENNLLQNTEHLVQGRKEQDVLYELLLKLDSICACRSRRRASSVRPFIPLAAAC